MEIKNNLNKEEIAEYVASIINQKLKEGKKVLFFVCGGSSLETEVLVSQKLENFNEDNLTITLSDERWGEMGHKDSNWEKLKNLGFNFENKKLIPFLIGKSVEETKSYLENELRDAISKADYKVAFMGMGSDGHTGGILPKSPAVFEDGLLCYYDGGVFERFTTTFKILENLDEVFLYVFGSDKWAMVENLNKDIDKEDMPAQILKKVKQLTIFTDYK